MINLESPTGTGFDVDYVVYHEIAHVQSAIRDIKMDDKRPPISQELQNVQHSIYDTITRVQAMSDEEKQKLDERFPGVVDAINKFADKFNTWTDFREFQAHYGAFLQMMLALPRGIQPMGDTGKDLFDLFLNYDTYFTEQWEDEHKTGIKSLWEQVKEWLT